ncbi:class I SAM-dependent methyltransferase [Mycobacterium sherrisii]|uniref:Methyltransferase type 11 n=1 Tax=Mycobacterium sherrisii TaxID=243061 RepID=A0A1E3T273_9MYCO|nr:class I SAM-dependent methyltransferase [Mycobacterium sherrisii]MCV7030360.1 class I SAM-dependent methyltransferase [Mycobacterium sherrisii]MEC4763869.1 class I SAM-dependent methyltransferase [Mycobacterium sherrisii]ODR08484.1 methyltransferase type 11 [Mycobacterium sherrisii]ORW75370.1 methyltransferase type 11 [Mycobacterium sherrisii]
MTSLSTEPSPSSDRQPHLLRDVAESFGVDADRYDRSRPRYPEEMIQRVIAASPGCEFLDVGCGTGIGARQYRAAGVTVLGVDPDPRMAEVARRSGIEVEIGNFETWDARGRTFDAVVAGQAWHWVDPVRGPGKAAQVLRPEGLLALYWHVFDPPADIAAAFDDVLQRVAPDAPLQTPGVELQEANLKRAMDGIRTAGGFTEPQRWEFEWERRYTRDEWLDHLATTGTLTVLPAEQVAAVRDAVGAAIDAVGGAFTMHYVTLASAARLT